MTRQRALKWLAMPAAVSLLVACSSEGKSRDVNADDWREVSRVGVTFEIPADWSDASLSGPCVQNDPCSSDPARLSAHVFFLQPLPGQRGGFGWDQAPTESERGWTAVAAFDGVDMYVRGDSMKTVQRVIDSARPGNGANSTN